jgi:hypothetical protein
LTKNYLTTAKKVTPGQLPSFDCQIFYKLPPVLPGNRRELLPESSCAKFHWLVSESTSKESRTLDLRTERERKNLEKAFGMNRKNKISKKTEKSTEKCVKI